MRSPGSLLMALALVLGVSACAVAQPVQLPVRSELDVVYGKVGETELKLDLYRPDNDQTYPGIVFVHGGGWSGGSKADFRDFAKGLAGVGYVTCTVDYRLVKPDANKWPAQLDDVQRAVRWFRSQAATYHLNPARVGAVGASAGGHLVACLATRDTRDNSVPELATYSSRVQCVLDLFGPTDLTSDFSTHGQAGPMVQKLVTDLFGKPAAEAAAAYHDASPLFAVDAHAAPCLIFHGTEDPLVPQDQSERFDAALKKAGVESTLVILAGEGHGFAKPESIKRLLDETGRFLARHLGGP